MATLPQRLDRLTRSTLHRKDTALLGRRHLVRRFWLLALVALMVGPLAPGAAAHPMGDFTISRYSRLVAGADQLTVHYVLDMAEIPTVRERAMMDADGDGQVSQAEANAYATAAAQRVRQGVSLTLDGATTDLAVLETGLTFPEGQGGLPILRLEVTLAAALPAGEVAIIYRDDNDPERDGWREIIMQAGADRQLRNATVPAIDLANALRDYPPELVENPPYMRVARATVVPAPGASGPVALAEPAGERTRDPLATLIATETLSLPALLLLLLVAFGLGAVHALSPGHGKAMVGAYLVGEHGSTRHAVALGLTVTLTHTAGVFALGLITLFLSRVILPERLYPWLGATSGLLVCSIGLGLLWRRLRGLLAFGLEPRPALAATGWHDHDGDWHSHAPAPEAEHCHGLVGHHHHHGPGEHTHALPVGAVGRVTWRDLLALGVSGGLVPCPSALVVLLSAVALNRVALGLLLIVAFSAGLAAVLTGIGLLLVHAGRLLARLPVEGRLRHGLPVVSALLVTLAGLAITIQALRDTGLTCLACV